MHTQGMAIDFIERCFGSAKLTNAGLNANVCCPVCNETDKKKLAIRTDNWLTKCWVCGYKAKTIYGLLKRYKPLYAEEFISQFNAASLVSDAEENAIKKELELLQLPTGFQLLAEWWHDLDDAPTHVRQATKYLKDRGLTERDFWYFKFGVTELDKSYINRIIVPSHDLEGNLNFFTARTFKSYVKPKYFNPRFRRETVVFNEINIDWDEELTIVEGPFDMFKVNDNATCLLGKELTKHCALFQAIVTHNTPVLLCLDNDAKRATLEIAKLLYDYGTSVKILELPEEIKDPGEISRNKFMELKQVNTIEFDDVYYLRNIIK
jgi:DNA primase